MTIDKKVSERFYLIYFIAACVVVSIHCGQEMDGGMIRQEWMRSCINWAVPFFFLLSGTFFRMGYINTFSGFCATAKKKFFTLFIPYLLWCLIGFVMRFPLVQDEFCQMSLGGMIDSLFGITTSFPIGNGVLWFVRTLIVLQFGLMALWGCISKDKKLRVTCWGGGGILLLSAFLPFGGARIARVIVDAALTNPSAAIYFFVGFFFAKGLVARSRPVWDVLMLVVGIVICGVIGSLGWVDFKLGRHILNIGVILSLIGGCDLLLARWNRPLGNWIYTTFFIYCFHRVPVEYMGKSVNKMTFLNADVRFFLFVAFSVVLVVICAQLLKRYLPRVYAILSGGRM